MSLPPNLLDGMVLSKEERSSVVWQSLRKRLEKKLEDLRKRNDDANLSDTETARLRGHIEALKRMLAWDADPPPQQARQVPNVTAARQVLG